MKDLGNTLLLLMIAGLMLFMVFGPYKRMNITYETGLEGYGQMTDIDTGVVFSIPEHEYYYVAHYGVTDVMAEAIVAKYEWPEEDFNVRNLKAEWKNRKDKNVYLLLRLRKRWANSDPSNWATGDWTKYEETEDETQNTP